MTNTTLNLWDFFWISAMFSLNYFAMWHSHFRRWDIQIGDSYTYLSRKEREEENSLDKTIDEVMRDAFKQ